MSSQRPALTSYAGLGTNRGRIEPLWPDPGAAGAGFPWIELIIMLLTRKQGPHPEVGILSESPFSLFYEYPKKSSQTPQ
jgi:hypothetical protein